MEQFSGQTMQDVMRQVKETLGPEAVIIATRTVRSLKGPVVEITASRPDSTVAAPSRISARPAYGDLEFSKPRAAGLPGPRKESTLSILDPPRPVGNAAVAAANMSGLLASFESLRREVLQAQAGGGSRAETTTWLTHQLCEAGFSPGAAAEIEYRMHRGNGAGLEDVLRSWVKQNIQFSGSFMQSQGGKNQRVVALVGPTGVGKTTTIAKLAAEAVLRFRKKVCLISLDNYRIGAMDQLRRYAEILQVPVEVAVTPDQFSRALNKFADAQLVLVDTAGRSPKDRDQMESLMEFFDGRAQIEVGLVLSATERIRERWRTIREWQGFRVNHVLFTKLDEAESFGDLATLAALSQMPVSYFCSGQRVPEDVELATAEGLSRWILQGLQTARSTVGTGLEWASGF